MEPGDLFSRYALIDLTHIAYLFAAGVVVPPDSG